MFIRQYKGSLNYIIKLLDKLSVYSFVCDLFVCRSTLLQTNMTLILNWNLIHVFNYAYYEET